MSEDERRDEDGDDGNGRGGAGRDDTGRDRAMAERLRRNPDDPDAKLDRGLDESMDASDPPSVTAPRGGEPADSSGYDEAGERSRDA